MDVWSGARNDACTRRAEFHTSRINFCFFSGEPVIEYTEIACACGGRFYFPADGHCSLLFLFLLYEEVFFSEVSMSVTAAVITAGKIAQ